MLEPVAIASLLVRKAILNGDGKTGAATNCDVIVLFVLSSSATPFTAVIFATKVKVPDTPATLLNWPNCARSRSVSCKGASVPTHV